MIKTPYNGNDGYFTVLEIIYCSPDIYAVFFDSQKNDLYALQNIGSQFWIKFHNDLGEEHTKYFLLPVTNYLIQNRESCLNTFVKSCRFEDLGAIPVKREQFINPFLSPEIINKLFKPDLQ